jgi:hypothetical protein
VQLRYQVRWVWGWCARTWTFECVCQVCVAVELRPSHVRLSANRVRRTTQTPAFAIAMLQPTFDSTWNADAAERFLRRLGPVGLDSEKSVGGVHNKVRPGVGGLPGRVCGHGWNRADRRKIRRSNTLRRCSLRRYSDLVDICCNKCVSIDASSIHLTPCTIGAYVESAPLGPCIRPTALQHGLNSLPTARARTAMMLDSPLRLPDSERHARRCTSARSSAEQPGSNG